MRLVFSFVEWVVDERLRSGYLGSSTGTMEGISAGLS